MRRATILVVLAFGGCATTGSLSADSPAALKERLITERANDRWQAVIRKDYQGAYEFMSPASRESVSLAKFEATFRAVEYRAATVKKVECNAAACTVDVEVTYDFPRAKFQGIVTPLREDWIIDRGQAWYVYRL